MQSRRRFLSLSLAGVAGLASAPRRLRAEPLPEVSKVRLEKTATGICVAPEYILPELLRAEGFAEVEYVPVEFNNLTKAVAHGEADFSITHVTTFISAIDAGTPIRMLAGVHPGCFELFVNDRIHRILDLKGKSVGVVAIGSSPYKFVSVIAEYVGLDPATDINWVTGASPKPMELFAEGRIDGFLGLPPEPQELRARSVGRVILNSALDHPWSEYFCCMLGANPDFVQQYPIATKRVLRAVIKATDLCMTEPERVARQIVDGGFTPRYDYALQTLTEVPYNKWREYDPEDTVRFYSLRLRETGLIRSTPQMIIAKGTDWRFVKEVKRELKA